MKKIILFFIIPLVLGITGCSSEVKIKVEFLKQVTDRLLAEKQISDVIKVNGASKKVNFNWSEENEFSTKSVVVLSFLKKETLSENQIDKIAKDIKEKLAKLDTKVFLDIDIKDDDEEVLALFDMKKNDKFSIPLDWSNAKIAIFYTSTPKLSWTTQIDYFCGIIVEAESELPSLNYTYQPSKKSKLLSDLLKNLNLEIKSNKAIKGIDEMTGYDIKIDPPSTFNKYGGVYLTFSSAGSKEVANSSHVGFVDGATETLESCKGIISNLSNNNLYGIDIARAAASNVGDTKVLSY